MKDVVAKAPVVNGIGLGFRRALRRELLDPPSGFVPNFVEFAPENWMGVGGFWGRQVRVAAEKYPVLCHGLSLSLGSPEPLDWEFIGQLKQFLDDVGAEVFSEHLSYAKCGNAHLYDLLPMPFTEEAVVHVADRIRQVQDFLGRRVAIENVSYYTSVAPEMDEATFLCRVIEEADCDLLLDVNNVYVNAFNHKYDAHTFLQRLPLDKVVYIHMAGHEDRFDDIKIDTHGEPICEDVYDLFAWTVERLHPVPVLLERDNDVPEYSELQMEMTRLQEICDNAWAAHAS